MNNNTINTNGIFKILVHIALVRGACAHAQTRQSSSFSHTQRIDGDEDSDLQYDR